LPYLPATGQGWDRTSAQFELAHGRLIAGGKQPQKDFMEIAFLRTTY
jgi:hypothetical protein